MSSHWLLFTGILLFLLLFSEGCRNDPGGGTKEYPAQPALSSEVDSIIDSLYRRSKRYMSSSPDSARILAQKALEIATREHSELWECNFLYLIGTSYLVQSKYSQANDYQLRLLKKAQELDNLLWAAKAHNSLGNMNVDLENFKDALFHYLKSLDLYDMIHDDLNRAKVLINISIVYGETSNYARALLYVRQSRNAFKKVHDTLNMRVALIREGEIYLQIGQSDSALFIMNQAMHLPGAPNDQSYLLLLYGDVYYQKGDFDQSISSYRQAKELAMKIGRSISVMDADLSLGKVYVKIGEYEKGLFHVRQALETGRNLDNSTNFKDMNTRLAEIFQLAGNYKNAYQFIKAADSLREKTKDQNNLHQIYNLEIENLNENIKMKQSELSRRKLLIDRRNNVIIILIFGFFTSITIMLLLYSRHKFKQRAILNLERSKAALVAEIEERKRLGLELHDGVGPLISLAKLNINALIDNNDLSRQKQSVILKNAERTLDEIIREIKHLSHNLAPIVLIENGFEAALRDLVMKIQDVGQHIVLLDIIGLNGQMESYLEHALYRSILEILNNAMVHAHATEINIQIIKNKQDITMMIEDNGKGFSQDEIQSSKGLGIKSTMSRIESLNGKLYIDSISGRGTIITIIVPA